MFLLVERSFVRRLAEDSHVSRDHGKCQYPVHEYQELGVSKLCFTVLCYHDLLLEVPPHQIAALQA